MSQNSVAISKDIFTQTESFLMPQRNLPAIRKAIQDTQNQPLIRLWEFVEPAVKAEYEVIETFQKAPHDVDNRSDVRGLFRRVIKNSENLGKKVEAMLEELKKQKKTPSPKGKNIIANSTISVGGNMTVGDKTIINNNGDVGKQVNMKDNYGDINM